MCGIWGSERGGLRPSPLNNYNSMIDSYPVGLVTWLAQRINDFDLAYLHLMRADFSGEQQADVVTPVRVAYRGVLIDSMRCEATEAAITAGKLDAAALDTAFLASPDLPGRFLEGPALNTPDSATFYTPGPKGYTNFPTLYAA